MNYNNNSDDYLIITVIVIKLSVLHIFIIIYFLFVYHKKMFGKAVEDLLYTNPRESATGRRLKRFRAFPPQNLLVCWPPPTLVVTVADHEMVTVFVYSAYYREKLDGRESGPEYSYCIKLHYFSISSIINTKFNIKILKMKIY